MLKNLLQNKTKVFYILLLFSFLVAIRACENTIFYDPLIAYFKRNYMQTPLPKLNVIKLFFSMGFRFYLNSIISIGLLKLLFDDSKVVKFSIFLFHNQQIRCHLTNILFWAPKHNSGFQHKAIIWIMLKKT